VRAGYRGKWSKSPSGRWGDFWKDLRGVAGVRREVKRLEKLQLALAGESRMGIGG
jgi:hypothetical protein